jgi:hypothetical protein
MSCASGVAFMLDRKVVIYKDAGCAGKETTLPIREGLETVGSQTVLFVYILIARLFKFECFLFMLKPHDVICESKCFFLAVKEAYLLTPR